jgi:hypothetical protein
LIIEIVILFAGVSEVSVFADILLDLVDRGLLGLDKFGWVFFPANGEEGILEMLLRFLPRLELPLPSCVSFLLLRFRTIPLRPPLGVTLLRDRVVLPGCGSSSLSQSFS